MLWPQSKHKLIFRLVVPFLLLIIFSGFLQLGLMSRPELVNSWLESLGPFFILGYILIQTVAIVFPPIPGVVVALPVLAILGPLKGLILIYLVSTPAECLNFLIAKKYGRPFVKKLLGQRAIEKIDDYSKDAGLTTAVTLKFFEDNFFDYLSYGLGLTTMTFKQFVLINFLVGIPRVILEYVILTKTPNFTTGIILIEIVAGILTGSYVFYRHWKHKHQ